MTKVVICEMVIQRRLCRLIVDTRPFRVAVRGKGKQGLLLAQLRHVLEAEQEPGLAQATGSGGSSLER